MTDRTLRCNVHDASSIKYIHPTPPSPPVRALAVCCLVTFVRRCRICLSPSQHSPAQQIFCDPRTLGYRASRDNSPEPVLWTSSSQLPSLLVLCAGLGRCSPHRSLPPTIVHCLEKIFPLPLYNEHMEASYWLCLLVDSFYLL